MKFVTEQNKQESFSLSEHKSSYVGELIHLDLWGPYKVPSREGFKYFLLLLMISLGLCGYIYRSQKMKFLIM